MFHIYLWLFLLFAIFAWAYTVKHEKQWQKIQDQLEEDRQTFSNKDNTIIDIVEGNPYAD